MLSEHGCPIAPSTYYAARAAKTQPSQRVLRDEQLKVEIARVHAQNYGVYGARKVWLALNREGIAVARCTIERLMGELGLVGVRRGRRVRTTVADAAAPRPADLVERRFDPPAPNSTWVADFTYVPTWSGMVYVAFVIDAYARRILGWRAATTMRTELVLDALEQAVWTRQREGVDDLSGLICHHDAGSQGGLNWWTQHLDAEGLRWRHSPTAQCSPQVADDLGAGAGRDDLIEPGIGGGGRLLERDRNELARRDSVFRRTHRDVQPRCSSALNTAVDAPAAPPADSRAKQRRPTRPNGRRRRRPMQTPSRSTTRANARPPQVLLDQDRPAPAGHRRLSPDDPALAD